WGRFLSASLSFDDAESARGDRRRWQRRWGRGELAKVGSELFRSRLRPHITNRLSMAREREYGVEGQYTAVAAALEREARLNMVVRNLEVWDTKVVAQIQ